MHDSVVFPFVYLISLRRDIRWLEVALFPCHILCFAVYYVFCICTVSKDCNLFKIWMFHILINNQDTFTEALTF